MGNISIANPRKAAFAARAEQELASFHQAVSQLYGPAEAAHAAEDWLYAFSSATGSADSFPWRSIARTAASRLAARRQPGAFQRMRQIVARRAGHTPCFCSCGLK